MAKYKYLNLKIVYQSKLVKDSNLFQDFVKMIFQSKMITFFVSWRLMLCLELILKEIRRSIFSYW